MTRSISRLSIAAFAFAAAISTGPASAEERVTFTKDILPILQESCIVCHRANGTNLTGMIAPMSLTNYDEVRPWSKAIRKAVADRVMPPWHASDLTHGVFKNERTLSQSDIDTIVEWVDTGAVRGNPADAPDPRDFDRSPDGWTIGEPDLIVGLDEPYWVADDVVDIQPRKTFKITKEQLPETRYVKAVEFRPGSEVLHHIVAAALLPGDEENLAKQIVFGRIAPGTNAQVYEDGYGFELRPDTTISFSMHYHKEAGPGTGVWDQSQMAIRFSDVSVTRPVVITSLRHTGFEIPPHTSKWTVGSAMIFEEDFQLIDFMPHMHLRGSSARYTAFYPDGTSEILLDVPRYDYNWQTAYEYATYKTMPGGTRIELELTFDNSPERGERAGVNPDRAIRFGGPTTDEMDLGFLSYALVEEGKRPEGSWGRNRAEGNSSE